MAGGEERKVAGVADVVVDRRRPALAGGADQRLGGVHAGRLHAALVQQPAQHALPQATSTAASPVAGASRRSTPGRTTLRWYSLPDVADVLVVPVGDVGPVGGRGGRRVGAAGSGAAGGVRESGRGQEVGDPSRRGGLRRRAGGRGRVSSGALDRRTPRMPSGVPAGTPGVAGRFAGVENAVSDLVPVAPIVPVAGPVGRRTVGPVGPDGSLCVMNTRHRHAEKRRRSNTRETAERRRGCPGREASRRFHSAADGGPVVTIHSRKNPSTAPEDPPSCEGFPTRRSGRRVFPSNSMWNDQPPPGPSSPQSPRCWRVRRLLGRPRSRRTGRPSS